MRRSLCLFFCLLSFTILSSQNKSFTVKYITEAIILDGDLNESVWQSADSARDFWQYFPTDSVQAQQQAEIKMLFDDDNLYVGIIVNAEGNNYAVPSLRRDFRAGNSDNITLMFDTFNDGTNAILFGTNPEGVRREILLGGGGTDLRGFNTAWDTKWRSRTKKHDGYYVSEIIIPLYSFKYREGETKWRFNSYHFDTQTNERNTWIRIPQNQFIFNLAFMGDMYFEKPLGKSKSPISLIPYINTLVGKDYETNEETSDFKFGGDARITVGNSMNLDLTVNPDFSQVEVDQQVTNLTRFEIGLPERRQFFLENADLFDDFGNSRDSNPFFSRRIGIAEDLDGNNIQNDIIAGARLSGKLTNNTRIGVLNMQTTDDQANEIAATNNALITVQQKLFSRSNISAMFINKQATKDYEFLAEDERYNRVFGLDYRLASEDNTWTGKYFIHGSLTSDDTRGFSYGMNTEYNSRNFGVRISAVHVDEDYNSALGFIRRTDITKIDPRFQYNIWPEGENRKVVRHEISVTPIFIWRPSLDFENSDYSIFTRWEVQFENNSQFNASIANRYVRLYDPFDPTGTDGAVELPEGDYYYTSVGVEYESDRRKLFSYRIEPRVGQFFNGNIFTVESSINYRIQPYFTGSMQLRYDQIRLPAPFPDANLWLIGPRLDITFNKSLFWATFIQYSSQSDNFSINTRLQWRFAPLSDLFVVYNDNYFTDSVFAPRVRSFNVKLTYWLNI